MVQRLYAMNYAGNVVHSFFVSQIVGDHAWKNTNSQFGLPHYFMEVSTGE